MRYFNLFFLTFMFLIMIAIGIDTYLLPATMPVLVEFLLAVGAVCGSWYIANIIGETFGDKL